LRQREHDLAGPFIGPQLIRAEVGFAAIGEAKCDCGPFLVTEENQRAIAARLASTFARDTLLDQPSAEIGVDLATIGLVDALDKRCIADPFPACKLREPAVLIDPGLRFTGHGSALRYNT
jgi:hypothetical protein